MHAIDSARAGVRRGSWRRLLAGGFAAAALVAIGGAAEELRRFGGSEAAAAVRVERHVRGRFDAMIADLSRVAGAVARDPAAARGLAAVTEGARALFDVLDRAVRADDTERIAVTIYNTAGEARAWIGRASDITVTESRPFFVRQSPLGLRLVHVLPIEAADRVRVGAVVVEHVLSPAPAPTMATTEWLLATPLGPAALRLSWETVGDRPGSRAFLLKDPSGATLVEAEVAPETIAASRTAWRRQVGAATLGVLAVTLLLLAGPLLDRRAVSRDGSRTARLTVAAIALVAAGAATVWSALALVEWHRSPAMLLLAAGLGVSIAALLAGPATQLRVRWSGRRRSPADAPAAFAAAHLTAGAALAAAVGAFEAVLLSVVDPATVDLRHFSLYPWSGARLTLLCGMLAGHAAALWLGTLALVVARAPWRMPRGAVPLRALMLGAWLAPTAAVAAVGMTRGWVLPAEGMLVSGGACALAALLAHRIARWYRHATVVARILTLFLAFLVPALLLYPSVEFYAGRSMRRLIAERYAVEALNHPLELQDNLTQALEEIDANAAVPTLVGERGVAPCPAAESGGAFLVWRQTALARARLTSAVELYDARDCLVSRFALNFPEYTGTVQPPLATSGCRWDVFGEAAPFGSEERNMLHAERKVCARGPDGAERPVGAIVVHVVVDYRTLPFITSQSPYIEVFRPPDGRAPREGTTATHVETVIYGWGLRPVYVSGDVAWPISEELFGRIYRSRDPFWTEIDHGGEAYRVYFANDRTGIFGLGYRAPTLFDDLVHLAELTTLAAAVYGLVLFGTGVFTRLSRERPKVGRALLREIRASFYRKLFLAFVLASIIPVITLALVIREYFAGQLRADVQAEAARTAAVAQRVIEEAEADAQRREVAEGLVPSLDDTMIAISQLIDQDVNKFDGPRLIGTSERDLFASGLLPERTPHDVYRAIVLQRLPGFVGEDRIGTFPYMIAAAPVRTSGPNGILTIPLANQQREIEREIDELDRGVLLAVLCFVLLGAGIGLSMAERIADPVRRLTRATRQIARGDFDARIAVRSADELRRLVDAFNSMAAELKAQRAQLERTHRLEAWAEMARQVAHEIKNPLTPIQLSAEHLRRVHADRGEPLGEVLEGCVASILGQVRLLRQISAEFSSFASSPTAKPTRVNIVDLVAAVVEPYRTGLAGRVEIVNRVTAPLPDVFVDRTLVARALANVVENALHAMPGTGTLSLDAAVADGRVVVRVHDTGVGMDEDALARVFEPYFSTKTTGTGLGLPIALRNVELNGGTLDVVSRKGEGTTVRMALPTADVF